MVFPESALAHRYLDGLKGIEIGGSAHNPFGLDTKNVDIAADISIFKQAEIEICGTFLPVDIVASGDHLPMDDQSVDFVLSSHVLEHFSDPVRALLEWCRVIKPGGYIFMIVPHKERTFDAPRERTTLQHHIADYMNEVDDNPSHGHAHVWIAEDVIELLAWMRSFFAERFNITILQVQDVDDKVGNGMTLVLQKL